MVQELSNEVARKVESEKCSQVKEGAGHKKSTRT